MASGGRFSYYICGSNLCGQMEQMLDRPGTQELYCTTPIQARLSGENINFCITWSQIWVIEDCKVSCFGFNRDTIQEILQELDPCTVVPLQRTTVIGSTDGFYQINEDGCVREVVCRQDDKTLSLLGGTNNTAIAIDESGQLCEARLDRGQLCEARLDRGQLCEARLDRGQLCEARLDRGQLCEARLDRGQLCEARLDRGQLCEARLDRGELCEARLDRGQLCEARLDRGELCEARLDRGQLCEARLDRIESESSLLFACPTPSIDVRRVACGQEHVLILSTDRDLYTYGSNSRGQLGHGELSVDEMKSPQRISTLEGFPIDSIAAGGWHSLAVSAEGDLYVWGWNEKGQLGLPSPNVKARSSQHHNSTSHSHCSVKDESTLKEKGSENREEMLEVHQSIEPVIIMTEPFGLDLPDDIRVKTVACGSRHTCVLLDSCLLMTCGWNRYGQLGHGHTVDCDYLHAVSSIRDKLLNVVGVHAGAWNTIITTQSNQHNVGLVQ